MSDALVLDGVDGSNPLGFLTAVGALQLAAHVWPAVTLQWVPTGRGWRPALTGQGCDRPEFVMQIQQTLLRVKDEGFKLSPMLPFARDTLREAMAATVLLPSAERWISDLLAGLGTDAYADKDGKFEDTSLRLVRSGDPAGNGLPAYVRRCRDGLDTDAIADVLFAPWRYEDDCPSLRWDPVEDQSHALRWDNPADKANKRAGACGVKAANAIAATALGLLPVHPVGRHGQTTGFVKHGRVWCFTWPLWTAPCGLDTVRSLLALAELTHPTPATGRLSAMGIAAVMRADCVAQSMYYRNFAPARPL